MVFLLALQATAFAQPRAFGPGRGGAPTKEMVRARAVADVSSVEPGGVARVGVRLAIEPHWHVYWRSPGETGLPTTLELRAPEGWTVGETRHPRPLRFEDSGIVSFGYENEVIVYAEVRAPAGGGAGGETVSFGVTSSWLVCAEDGSCIPGDFEGEIEITLGERAASQDAALVERFAATVPAPYAPPASDDQAAGSGGPPVKVTFEPGAAGVAPGAKLAQRVIVEGVGGARLVTDGASVSPASNFFPDLGDDFAWTPMEPARAIDATPDGTARAIEFPWTLEAYEGDATGTRNLRPALYVTVALPDGTRREIDLVLERPVMLGAAGPLSLETPIPATPEPGSATPESNAAAPGETPDAASTAPPEATVLEETGKMPVLRGDADPDAPVFSFLRESPAPERGAGSFLLFMIFAFFGGVLLNVMPCVLPVLSIKVLSFVHQAGAERGRILRLGLVFAAGVFVSFAALATLVVGLQGAGRTIGWGFQMTEPRFLVVMCGVIFAFGLSMFGVFEIELPGSAVQTADGLQRREGPAGAFFNGVLATVLATPCTAPMLGPALGFAFSQPPVVIYAIFLAVAAGLSAPYVLLSAFPGWLKVVPRPGPWMDVFKQSMGFLLMATVVWLLWILGRQAGPEGIVATLAFLVALGAGCWLIGFGFDFGATSRRRAICVALALGLVAGGYAAFPGKRIRELKALEASATEPAASGGSDAAPSIDWQPFSVERVEALAAEGRTIFVDFTADWCLTCKVNERGTLATASVAEAFAKHGVVALKADYTRQPPELTRILRAFGRAGVPMYLVFPAGRPGEPIVLPEALTPGVVIDAVGGRRDG